jgi:hypothetical protein
VSKWIDQIFDAKIATREGVVRRKKSTVEKYATVKELTDEVRRRGFHLVETGDQFIIVCNNGSIKIVV